MGIQLEVYRIDKDLPLPKYETRGSVAMDLIARADCRISVGDIGRIPANVIVRVPQGYVLEILPRSSTPMKMGLVQPHSVGIIDQDYCGPDDEIRVQVWNITNEDVVVPRGTKIAQAILRPVAKVLWWERDLPPASVSRGGFGSTDEELPKYFAEGEEVSILDLIKERAKGAQWATVATVGRMDIRTLRRLRETKEWEEQANLYLREKGEEATTQLLTDLGVILEEAIDTQSENTSIPSGVSIKDLIVERDGGATWATVAKSAGMDVKSLRRRRKTAEWKRQVKSYLIEKGLVTSNENQKLLGVVKSFGGGSQ